MTIKDVAQFFGLSWDVGMEIQKSRLWEHYRKPKLKRFSQIVIDEISSIDFNKASFPWAFFRQNKSGIKLHTLLDHNGYLPAVVNISNAKNHDAQKAKTFRLEKGAIVVFDWDYYDYDWYAELGQERIMFCDHS